MALVARLATAYNDRDPEALTEIFAAGYTEHGPEDYAAFFQWSWRILGPDARLRIDNLIADGDRVGCVTTLTGAFTETEYGIAPTGRPLVFSAVELFRVRDGRIVEHWDVADREGLISQMSEATSVAGLGTPSTAASATRPNAAAVCAIADAHTRRDIAALDGIFAHGYLEHSPEGFDGFFRWSLAAFPDAELRLEHLVADGDRVGCVTVLEGTFTGTPTGPLSGRQPTGKPVSFAAVDLFWMRDGMVVEHRDVVDRLGLLAELDAGPASSPGEPP